MRLYIRTFTNLTDLNDDVISLCIYSDGLLQPRDLQLGSHFIIMGANVICINFYIHVSE